jgi:hypothetical protein
MRSFLAFLLGILFTVAFAFIHDTAVSPPAKPYVNWDAVQDSARGVADFTQAQWNRLVK